MKAPHTTGVKRTGLQRCDVGSVDPRFHGKDPADVPGPEGSYPLLCHLLDSAVVMERLWSTRVRPKLRRLLSDTLGLSESATGQVLSLLAAVHDVGKLNPFFQYQERSGAESAYAEALLQSTGLPRTPPLLRDGLNATSNHPLRRHEFVSYRILTGEWPRETTAAFGQHWLPVLAAGHHGYWRGPTPDLPEAGDSLLKGWSDQQHALVRLIEEAVGLKLTDVPPLAGAGAPVVTVCFSGLLTLADWIASDDGMVRAGKERWVGCTLGQSNPYSSGAHAALWMEARSPELRDHTDAALGAPSNLGTSALREAVLGQFHPRPLQAEALHLSGEDDPGLWICMYPTGDGKSEAAMLRGAADIDEGFFFGLPTLATTDAMEARLHHIISRLGPTHHLPLRKSHQFAHSEQPPELRDHSDDESCDQGNPNWYTNSIRKLVSPNVVGTVDQVLVGALAQRHITLRLFGLANHHVILDEIHTFDVYQTELLIELLYWWGATRTRVTLLSATLASSHMRLMVQAYSAGLRGVAIDKAESGPDRAIFPSTVSVSGACNPEVRVQLPVGEIRKPHQTHVTLIDVESRIARIREHVEWAIATAAPHPQSPIAIVSNVVADCQEIGLALLNSPAADTHEVLVLHSSMVAAHRQAVERRLTDRCGVQAHQAGFSRDKPILIVGTQVIQASLDFDVDFMSTDLAPAPDLLQRLGRCWRFATAEGAASRGGRLPAGMPRQFRVVGVVGENGKPTPAGSRPYLAAVIRRTHAMLKEQVEMSPTIDILGFSQPWVDAAYDKDPLALLDEEDEARAATDEIVSGISMQGAAELSRAALGRPDASHSPLLPTPTLRRGPRWSDLVGMTSRPDSDEAMRTRYIEVEALRVLLFDSSGQSAFRVPGWSQPQTLSPIANPSQLNYLDAMRLSITCSMCSVPHSLRRIVDAGIATTLDGHEWHPKAKELASTPPLDLAHIGSTLVYHPVVGLVKGHTRD